MQKLSWLSPPASLFLERKVEKEGQQYNVQTFTSAPIKVFA